MLDKIQGCFMGVMIGDAMGMPVELMTAQDIAFKTDGAGITGFHHPIQRKIKDTENLPVGSTTDDWQLTEAILSSLIRRKSFDINDIALAHVEALETSTFGWGGTTRNGMKELTEYFDSRGVRGRSPLVAPEMKSGRGMGNGPAMKISPVGVLSVLEISSLYDDRQLTSLFSGSIAFEFADLASRVAKIGRLTHADPRSWAAAYAVAIVIAETMTFGSIGLDDPTRINRVLDRIIEKVSRFEATYGVTDSDTFTKRLMVLKDLELLLGPIERVREAVGVGCICLESVAFAVAVFLRHALDFRTAILEAVNSGGDADTTAAMVGSMVGSAVGLSCIPPEWRSFNTDFEKSVKLGELLLKATVTK